MNEEQTTMQFNCEEVISLDFKPVINILSSSLEVPNNGLGKPLTHTFVLQSTIHEVERSFTDMTHHHLSAFFSYCLNPIILTISSE